MRKVFAWTMLLLALTIPVTGCGSRKQTAPAPVQVPSTSTPSAPVGKPAAAPGLAGDSAALQSALSEKSPIHFEIVTVADTGGKEKNDYLDSLLAEKKWPEASSLVLLVFTKDNDLRFAMGADFFAKKVSVDEMLALTKSTYFPKARENDPAGGLAALVQAVNRRMAQ